MCLLGHIFTSLSQALHQQVECFSKTILAEGEMLGEFSVVVQDKGTYGHVGLLRFLGRREYY